MLRGWKDHQKKIDSLIGDVNCCMKRYSEIKYTQIGWKAKL